MSTLNHTSPKLGLYLPTATDETNVIDTLQQEFRSQHPHASAVIALILIVVGAGLILPAVMAGILGVVGFGAGGVVAGRYFPRCFARISSLQTNTTIQEVLRLFYNR